MAFHVIIVPAPNVVVTATNTSLYIGSSLTLTCTVTLDPSVDNNETVSTSWSGPNDAISGDGYLFNAASGSGGIYTSSLTISALGDQDNGTYTCTGIVTGANEQQVTASDSHTLAITRKTLFEQLQAI